MTEVRPSPKRPTARDRQGAKQLRTYRRVKRRVNAIRQERAVNDVCIFTAVTFAFEDFHVLVHVFGFDICARGSCPFLITPESRLRIRKVVSDLLNAEVAVIGKVLKPFDSGAPLDIRRGVECNKDINPSLWASENMVGQIIGHPAVHQSDPALGFPCAAIESGPRFGFVVQPIERIRILASTDRISPELLPPFHAHKVVEEEQHARHERALG